MSALNDMGKNGRRLVGYRVRLHGRLYSLGPGAIGSTPNARDAQLYRARSLAQFDKDISPQVWKDEAQIVAVYRRSKAGAK